MMVIGEGDSLSRRVVPEVSDAGSAPIVASAP
jgi:hypothetical protein